MKIAVVCAMNQNRSMEAHKVLLEAGYNVNSYGTNKNIKLPGETVDKPNIYPFGTTFKQIYDDLSEKDEVFYTRRGLLDMLKRNMKIKDKAKSYFESMNHYDLVFTAEEKCFSSIFEIPSSRFRFLINFNIKDNYADASVGAQEIIQFIKWIEQSKESQFEGKVKEALEKYTEMTGKMLLFTCKADEKEER